VWLFDGHRRIVALDAAGKYAKSTTPSSTASCRAKRRW
jgi:hypothetical protein